MRSEILLTGIMMLWAVVGWGQDIATDSKNKGVFTNYSIKKYRMDFSSKDFSFTFSSIPIAKKIVIGDTTNVKK